MLTTFDLFQGVRHIKGVDEPSPSMARKPENAACARFCGSALPPPA
jgi:hypothetical protein